MTSSEHPHRRAPSFRQLAASCISLISLAVGLVVAWQAVRFYQGEVGNVIVDVVFRPRPESEYRNVFIDAWHYKILAPFLGVVTWLLAGAVVFCVGIILSGVTGLGWREYARRWAEEQRAAAVQAQRDRRRELRNKLRAASSSDKPTFSLTTLAIGIVLGALFF